MSMRLVNTAGRYKRFKSKQHAKNYHALRRRKAGNLGWAWRQPAPESK